ncbi:hypothetical protein ACC703_12910 [Rhizobium ruizarguesonis]
MPPSQATFHYEFPGLGFDALPWGIECDNGWLPILADFCASVGAVVSPGDFSLVQVKEKFGALQVYYALRKVDPETERAVSDARDVAFKRSLHVCEVCGKRGRVNYFDGLYKTVCQEHANSEFGIGMPVETADDVISDHEYDASSDPFVTIRPTAEEFHTAPLLVGWALADDELPWIHAWFFDHPEITDGTHGHTSPLVKLDDVEPPQWARTETRLYRLGIHYETAEREIRYWTQKHLGVPMTRGSAPGGNADIETMLAFLRSTGRLRRIKVDKLEQAYLKERERSGQFPQDNT